MAANTERPLDATSSDQPQTLTTDQLCELVLGILRPMGRGEQVSALFKQLYRHNRWFYPAKEWMDVFHAFVSDAASSIERVPIGANCGSPGSGKTTQLLYLGANAQHCQITVPEFDITWDGMTALFVSPNGSNVRFQETDVNIPRAAPFGTVTDDRDMMPASVSLRMAWRILHATTNLPYDDFLYQFEHAIGDHVLRNVRTALSNPEFFGRILSRRLALEERPLLLLVDELRMIGMHLGAVPIVAKSKPAYEAFQFLASVSQHSFETFRDVAADPASRECATPPIFVIASALCAHDPTAVATESGRPVVLFPLPPLPLGESEAYVVAGRDIDQGSRAAVRGALWMSQYSSLQHGDVVRRLKMCVTELLADTATTVERDQRTRASDAAYSRLPSFFTACQDSGCRAEDLLRNLFWPAPPSQRDTWTRDMHVAKIAEATGLCRILRRDGGDTVYMHPVILFELCMGLPSSSLVRAVSRLSQQLLLPADPPCQPTTGKLYEGIIHALYAVRVMTCPTTQVGVVKLLGGRPDARLAAQNIYCEVRCDLPRKVIEVVPRCAADRAEALKDPPTHERRQVERPSAKPHDVYVCKQLPGVDDAPWTCFETLHSYNNVLDSAIVLRVIPHGDGTKKAVCLAFQNEECVTPADALAKFRCLWNEFMLEGGDHFARFLAAHQFVHVLVTPNPPGATGAGFSPCPTVGNEVFVSNDEIRKFCPTVAYSGCDARVLYAVRSGGTSVN